MDWSRSAGGNRGNRGSGGTELHIAYDNIQNKDHGKMVYFLNQQCNSRKWNRLHYRDDKWVLFAKSASDAQLFLRDLTDARFNNRPIRVSLKGRGDGGSAFSGNNSNKREFTTRHRNEYKLFRKELSSDQKGELRAKLGQRYNQGQHFLNLNGLVHTLDWADFANAEFTDEVLKIIKECCSEMKTLDLAHNEIFSLKPFEYLVNVAPALINLSLADNAINHFSELRHLKCFGKDLHELVLKNERMKEASGGDIRQYVSQVVRYLPALKRLDNQPLDNAPLVSFGARIDETVSSGAAASRLQVTAHNPSNCLDQSRQFINALLNTTDKDRNQMKTFYHVNAQFSISFMSSDTPTPEHRSDQYQAMMQATRNVNRNLVSSIFNNWDRNRQLNSVFFGNQSIADFWIHRFPSTSHSLELITIDDQIVTVPSAKPNQKKQFDQVSMQGYYAEDEYSARKFQRTLLLSMENNTIVIVNDQMHVGGSIDQCDIPALLMPGCETDAERVKKKESKVGDSRGGGSGGSGSGSGGTLSPEQNEKVKQIMSRFNCNPAMAAQVLQRNNWNFQQTVTHIQQNISPQK